MKLFLPSFIISVSLVGLLPASAGVLTGDTIIEPDTTTTPVQPGDLTVSGKADVLGNLLNFGSAVDGTSAYPAVIFNYFDDPSGEDSSLTISGYRESLTWKWQQNSSTGQVDKMKLDQNNALSLYDASGVAKIILDPNVSEITLNGQVLLTPNSYGNLGLGTTSPTEKLDVVGAIKASEGLIGNFLSQDGPDGEVGIFLNPAEGAGVLSLKVADIERLTILQSGNVGIGTTTPLDKLDVEGTLRLTGTVPSIRTASNRFSINETGATPPSETGMVSQFSSGEFGRSVFAVTHTGFNTAFFGLDDHLFSIGGEGNTDIRFVKGLDYGSSNILDSGSEAMRIQASTGNVGIGSSTPEEKLDVNGNAVVRGNLSVTTFRILPQGDLPMGDFTEGTEP